MRKWLLLATAIVLLLGSLAAAVAFVPSLRNATLETVAETLLSADRVSIGTLEIDSVTGVVLTDTAFHSPRARLDVGRLAMAPQIWAGLWQGLNPVDYMSEVRVERVAGSIDAFGRNVPVQLVDMRLENQVRPKRRLASTAGAVPTEEPAPAAPALEEEEATTTVLHSRLLLRGQQIELAVELDARRFLAGEPTEFTAELTAELAQVSASGTARKGEKLQIDGDFSIRTGSLDQLAQWILGEAPDALAGLGSFNGDGKLAVDGDSVRLSALRLDLAESHVLGELALKSDGERTKVDGSFTIDRIDFNRLAAAMPAGSAETAETGEPGRIDIAFLRDIEGLVKVTVAEVLAGPLVAGDLAIDIGFADAAATLHAATGLLGGTVKLNARASAADDTPAFSASLSGAYLQLALAAAALAPDAAASELSGSLSADVAIAAAGSTIAELQSSLDGRATAGIADAGLGGSAGPLRAGRLTLTAESFAAPITLAGGLALLSREVILQANGASLRQLLDGRTGDGPLATLAASAGGHRFEATLRRDGSEQTPRIALSLAGASAADLAAWLGGQEPPAASAVLQDYRLAAEVLPAAEATLVETISLAVDQIRFSGSARLDLAADRPMLQASLTGDSLDLTPYLGVAEASGEPGPPADVELLALRDLTAFDARIEITAASLSADSFRSGRVSLVATQDSDGTAATLAVADLYGGSIKADVDLHSQREDMPLEVALNFLEVDPGRILQSMFEVPGFGGKAHGELRLAGRGASLFALRDSMEANGRFRIDDAVVPPELAILSAEPAPGDADDTSSVSGVLLFGPTSKRADMQWQRGDSVVADFSLFEKKKRKRETELNKAKERAG